MRLNARIKIVGKQTGADVVIVEVGGTAGDIESLPFLEALRQLRAELKRRDSLYVHVTFLPHIGATDELKTKPTQHSVRELRGIGIQPNVIIARTDHAVNEDIISKIALFCDVDEDAVIPLETADNIYAVPLMIEETGLGEFILERPQAEGGPARSRRVAAGSSASAVPPMTDSESLSLANMLNCTTPICP